MKCLLALLNILSALAALAAAALWWHASVRLVRSDYDGPMAAGKYVSFRGERGPVAVASDGVRFDVIATMNLQSRLNSCAAKAAAVAALLQGISALLSSFG